MTLTVKDLEKLQLVCPDHRLELVQGEIIVMSPSGYESDEVTTKVARVLGNWVRRFLVLKVPQRVSHRDGTIGAARHQVF